MKCLSHQICGNSLQAIPFSNFPDAEINFSWRCVYLQRSFHGWKKAFYKRWWTEPQAVRLLEREREKKKCFLLQPQQQKRQGKIKV